MVLQLDRQGTADSIILNRTGMHLFATHEVQSKKIRVYLSPLWKSENIFSNHYCSVKSNYAHAKRDHLFFFNDILSPLQEYHGF